MKRLLGPEHLETLAAMNNLALLYAADGHQDQAIAMQEQVLTLCKKTMGPESPNTLAVMNNLARSYTKAGRQEDALKMSEETVALFTKIFGPEHHNTLTATNNLALSSFACGQHDKAIQLEEKLLASDQKVLGPEHPDTVTVMGVLSYFYREVDRTADASRLTVDSLAISRKSLPPDSPQLAAALATSGTDLLQMKDFTAAQTILRECLDLRQKLQPDAWSTFNTQSQLGGALLGLQNFNEAEPLLVAGYQGMKQLEATIPAVGKVRLPQAVDRLIDLYTRTNKPDQATKWQAERALYPSATTAPTK